MYIIFRLTNDSGANPDQDLYNNIIILIYSIDIYVCRTQYVFYNFNLGGWRQQSALPVIKNHFFCCKINLMFETRLLKLSL